MLTEETQPAQLRKRAQKLLRSLQRFPVYYMGIYKNPLIFMRFQYLSDLSDFFHIHIAIIQAFLLRFYMAAEPGIRSCQANFLLLAFQYLRNSVYRLISLVKN